MRTLTAIDDREIRDLLARDEFFWLDLTAPSPEDVEKLEGLLSLHPRCTQGLREPIGRPVLEEFESHVLLAFFGITEESVEPVEVRLVISGGFVLTIHEQPIESLERLTEHGVHGDEGEVIYTILGALATSFFKAVDKIDEVIDTIEEEIMGSPNPGTAQLRRLVNVKNQLVRLRHIATKQRDVLGNSIDEIGSLPGLQARPRDFRDVYQQMISVSELIDSARDVLTGAQDVYLSAVSNRLNQVVERLTIIATIFLPLTFVTGFFGQNFGWMIQHISSFAAFAAFGIGGLIGTLVILLLVFERAGYIDLPPARKNASSRSLNPGAR